MTTPRATIDCETRSVCSLKASGSWRYSLDPTTEILCLAFRLPEWVAGRTGVWHPAMPHLGIAECELGSWADTAALMAWVEDGGYVEAHNAFFERGIWQHLLVRQYGWPAMLPDRWLCSAAKAAVHALPRNLRAACEVLQLPQQKDVEGHAVLKKMYAPRKPTQADQAAWRQQHCPCLVCEGRGRVASLTKAGQPTVRGKWCSACAGTGSNPVGVAPLLPVLWYESREMLARLIDYCRADVLAEAALSARLPDLTPVEQEVYTVDQAINERGYCLDTDAVSVALTLLDQDRQTLNAELATLTQGAVEVATQRGRLVDWLTTQGVELSDTTKDTVERRVTGGKLPPAAHRALEILQQVGRSSTAKYAKMAAWVCPDGRIHGGLLYHGASTGRWTGQGVQPHNFVKGSLADMDAAWTVIMTGDAARITRDIRDTHDAPLAGVQDVLAQALRGVLVATPGQRLYVADYSTIETRVVLWLAGDHDALDVFRQSRDIYCEMATEMYGRPVTKADTQERQLGKVAMLGLGYQMGAAKFVEAAATYGIRLTQDHRCAQCHEPTAVHWKAPHDFVYRPQDDPEEMTAARVVAAYRQKFWQVKQAWADQERAAIEAVAYEDEVSCGNITWCVDQGFLYARLPSGRCLGYAEPQVQQTMTSWGAVRDQLSFMGVDPMTHQWTRQVTYGGSLVENLVQAIARDLLAEACVRVEYSGRFRPLLTVHDEVLAEGDPDQTVEDFVALLTTVPWWAEGLPVHAEGWSGTRYRK